MRSILILAATAFVAGPAVAQNGNAYSHAPKVCLVTFESAAAATSQADVGVIKAQYLPLPIAIKLEARSDSISDIYTYGEDGYTGTGVDFHYAGDSTEATCEYLADLAESGDTDN